MYDESKHVQVQGSGVAASEYESINAIGWFGAGAGSSRRFLPVRP
jgi:hypothetical protein